MKKRVVFICLGNSCRSIMAEALARHFHGDRLDAASAGLQPLGFITLETFQVLQEMGVATAGLRSKGLAEINLRECRVIINLTEYSLARVLPAQFQGTLMHRPVADPYGGSLETYRQTRDDIRLLLSREVDRGLG